MTKLYLTDSGMFFAAHNGKTFPHRLSEVDAFLAYATIEPSGCWVFRDGSVLAPEPEPNQFWADTREPVVRLTPRMG